MKSGLEGRNIEGWSGDCCPELVVSMKSGLEGRNNMDITPSTIEADNVSMKSGLEGRNNPPGRKPPASGPHRLNEVRPRRPEQCSGP